MVALQEVGRVAHRYRGEHLAGRVVAERRVVLEGGAVVEYLAVLRREPADARAGQPVFVEAADDGRARVYVGERRKRRAGVVLHAAVGLFVEYPRPVAVRDVQYPVELGADGNEARRVVRYVHDEELRLRRDVLDQEVHVEPPAPARNLERPFDDGAAERARKLVERWERRVHDDDLVAGLEHVVHKDEDALFGRELENVRGAYRRVARRDGLAQREEAFWLRVAEAEIVPELPAFGVGHVEDLLHRASFARSLAQHVLGFGLVERELSFEFERLYSHRNSPFMVFRSTSLRRNGIFPDL